MVVDFFQTYYCLKKIKNKLSITRLQHNISYFEIGLKLRIGLSIGSLESEIFTIILVCLI